MKKKTYFIFSIENLIAFLHIIVAEMRLRSCKMFNKALCLLDCCKIDFHSEMSTLTFENLATLG